MTMNKTRWITVEEMRDRLSISKTKAYQIASSRAIETVKFGRCLRISEDSLTHWLESLRDSKAKGGDDMR